MARSGHWQRLMGQNFAPDYKGFTAMGEVAPAETVVRTFWAFNCATTLPSTTSFPPGSAFVKVGLILRPPGAVTMVNPIDDPNEDWMDVMTCPWRGNIATSVNIDYQCFAGFGGPDKQARAQRFNASGTDYLQLYISWMSWFGQDTDNSFVFYTTTSADAYILEAA